MLISLTEYAQIHGRHRKTVQQKCLRGGFSTAMKIGNQWVIDSSEPYNDKRIKSGNYINWRRTNNEQ